MKKVFERLAKPFAAEDVEWRVQQSGMSRKNEPWAMVLCYVTNRAIMNRLDNVMGAENWKNHFEEAPQGGVLCGISIKVDDEWITKWDGADNTDIESVKGGLSSAMKRTAVQWGIGRYLYKLETNFVDVYENAYKGKFKVKIKDKQYSWDPPHLPEWALPTKTIVKKTKKKVATVGTPNAENPPNTKDLTTKKDSQSNGIPPGAAEYTNSQLIDAINKLSDELTPPDLQNFYTERLGLKSLIELDRSELFKFGRELKSHIKEKNQII